MQLLRKCKIIFIRLNNETSDMRIRRGAQWWMPVSPALLGGDERTADHGHPRLESMNQPRLWKPAEERNWFKPFSSSKSWGNQGEMRKQHGQTREAQPELGANQSFKGSKQETEWYNAYINCISEFTSSSLLTTALQNQKHKLRYSLVYKREMIYCFSSFRAKSVFQRLSSAVVLSPVWVLLCHSAIANNVI